MRITFETAGGIAPTPLAERSFTIDTDVDTDVPDADELIRLVHDAQRVHVPPAPRHPQPDSQTVRVVVGDGVDERVLEYRDGAPTAAGQRLVERLRSLANQRAERPTR